MLPSHHRWTALLLTLGGCVQLVLGPERELDAPGGGGAAGEGGGGGIACAQGDGNCCDGDVVWLRTFGDASYNHIGALAADGDGGIYLSGWFAGAIDLGAGPIVSRGNRDMFVGRLDRDGAPLWVSSYGTADDDEAGPSLTPHPQGVLLCGTNFTTLDFGAGPHQADPLGDAYVALLGPDGSLLWDRWIEGAGEQRCWGQSAVDPATGDVVVSVLFGAEAQVGSNTFVGQGQGDMLLLRLAAADGAVTHTRAFGTPSSEQPLALAVTADRRIAVCGFTNGSLDLGEGPLPHDGSDAFVALLAPDLTTVWGRVFAGSGNQAARDVSSSAAGDLLLIGSTKGVIDLGAGAITELDGGFVARLSLSDGLATRSAPLAGFKEPALIVEDPSGQLLVAGNYYGAMPLGGLSQAHAGSDPLAADAVAVKLSTDFEAVAWKQLAATSPLWETMTGMALGDGGRVFLSGSFHDTLAIDGCAPRPSAGDADAYLLLREP